MHEKECGSAPLNKHSVFKTQCMLRGERLLPKYFFVQHMVVSIKNIERGILKRKLKPV